MLDVLSFKPGNVHLEIGFNSTPAANFLLSAAAIAPVMEEAPLRPVGQTILDSIRATRSVANENTNLGIVLLLAPLASVPPNLDIRGGVMRTLIRLSVDDARNAYEAIRLAKPGGLGTVNEQDVSQEPTVTLREAMALAADRDMVAKQYVNDFEQTFEGAELLCKYLDADTEVEIAATRTFLQLLSKYPDSLIERKFGKEAAQRVTKKAKEIAHANFDMWEIHVFDAWLRRGCPERFRPTEQWEWSPATVPGAPNPGTTADLVTASLFVALRRGIIQLPLPRPKSSTE
jgi:triphosphoribosyl-dephospho-CoA synthase